VSETFAPGVNAAATHFAASAYALLMRRVLLWIDVVAVGAVTRCKKRILNTDYTGITKLTFLYGIFQFFVLVSCCFTFDDEG
jgi:mannose/fructose/N-acetylgalactosamine-specific phosphotransferase system component IIC